MRNNRMFLRILYAPCKAEEDMAVVQCNYFTHTPPPQKVNAPMLNAEQKVMLNYEIMEKKV